MCYGSENTEEALEDLVADVKVVYGGCVKAWICPNGMWNISVIELGKQERMIVYEAPSHIEAWKQAARDVVRCRLS